MRHAVSLRACPPLSLTRKCQYFDIFGLRLATLECSSCLHCECSCDHHLHSLPCPENLLLVVEIVEKVNAAGVENLDLSSVVGSSHFNYNRRMPEILPLLALDDCSTYVCRGNQEAISDTTLELSSSTDDVAHADAFVF